MKKNSEKFYLNYFISHLFFGIIGVVLFVYAILHPRPQNIVMCLVALLLVFLNRKWMKKPVEAGNEVLEKVKPKKMSERFVPRHFAVLFLGYIAYFFGSLSCIFFSGRMSYEYKGDIAKFKDKSNESYYFFPDEIPEGAENIKWIVMPSFMQGSGTEVLFFDASKEYIQEVIATYSIVAEICPVEDDMLFRRFYDETRLEKVTVYKIYDNDDENHVQMWGFFVDEEMGRIGFFCQ